MTACRPDPNPGRRAFPPDDDRGSLPMALLVMLVGLALAALLLPIAMTQNSITRFDNRRAVSLQAAESGLDVALGQIRAAGEKDESGQLMGDVAKLPCDPLSGTFGPDGSGSYVVTIAYFTADPTGRDAEWLADHQMQCVTGYGVYYHDEASGSDTAVPSFVLLTSIGTDDPAKPSRTLRATYNVSTTNANIAGGALPLFPEDGSADSYCLDAGISPAVGSSVVIQPCPTGGAPVPAPQLWAYLNNLTIQLTPTVGDKGLNDNGTGLCLRSPTVGSTPNNITLDKCPANTAKGEPGTASWNLLWSVNDSGHFEGSTTSKGGLNGYCLNVDQQRGGEPLTLEGCTGGTTDPHQAFNPMPSVGAGQAGEPNHQVVNFLLFGRCLDVTNQSTATGDNGGSFLILYPCKQNPNPGSVAWNQKFDQVEVTGGVQWRTYPGSGTYCLTSSRSVGGYVYVSTCSNGSYVDNQTWTRYEKVDAGGDPLPYKQKYTLVDSVGLCMSPGPVDDAYNKNLKVIVTTCDGSTGQKWNADPNPEKSALANLHETRSTGAGEAEPAG